MEEFSICFDTSKTRLNYREFLSNQVFNLPGGAYMSTHLDDDGAHRVSINLENLLGRRYKIVLSAKPALPGNENQITAAKEQRTREYENGRNKKEEKKVIHGQSDYSKGIFSHRQPYSKNWKQK